MLNLPNELLFMVAGNLPQLKDISSLIQTHSRFSALLTPLLHQGALEDVGSISALQSAAIKGQETLVRLLLKLGVDTEYQGRVVPVRNQFQASHSTWKALFLAIEYGRRGIVKLLLEAGADFQTCDSFDRGLTPLCLAASLSDDTIVGILLDHGADPDAVEKDSDTALHIATREGSKLMVRTLLDNGANVSIRGYGGATPLFQAEEGVAEILIEKGAAVNDFCYSGRTVLYTRVLWSESSTVALLRLLFRHGGDVNIPNKDGETVLHAAVRRGSFGIVEELLKMGADVTAKNFAGQSLFGGGGEFLCDMGLGAGAMSREDLAVARKHRKMMNRLLFKGVAFRRWDCERKRIVFMG